VLAYPKTENGIVTITTAFPGADPDAIAGFITTPIEAAVAQANGIDYMTSISQSGTSTITVNLRQNYDTSKAAAEINIKVNSVLNQLPTGSQQPAITVKVGQTTDAMYMGFSSRLSSATKSPTTCSAWCSPSCRPCRACRPPKSSAASISRCARG
jgi:multidrug efflux pump